MPSSDQRAGTPGARPAGSVHGDRERAADTTTPLISVVIPAHNFREGIADTVACVQRQVGVTVEIIVVDDGSSDGTTARLEQVADPRLRLIRHDVAMGVGAARNAGLAAARGEWIAFLDQDDLWAPTKLRRQLEAARAAGADFSYCGVVAVDGSRRVVDLTPSPDPVAARRLLSSFCAIPYPCSNILARTVVVRGIGGLDPRLSYIADWDFAIRLSDAGIGASCDEYLVGYLVHEQSMSTAGARRAFAELDHLRRKLDLFPDRLSADIDLVRFARYLARGQRRGGSRLRASMYYLRGGIHGPDAGSLVRAVGVLFGERVMAAGNRLLRATRKRGRTAAAADCGRNRPDLLWLDRPT